jgi:hypothetical protein
MDADQARYKEQGIGPALQIARESDWMNLLDEIELVCGKESPMKLDKANSKALEKFLDYDAKAAAAAISLDRKLGETVLSALEQIGVRALRDFTYLTILRNILVTFYHEQRDLDRFSDEL